MTTLQLQDAKAKFSELVDQAIAEGPQIVTRCGLETVVVLPVAEWRRLVAAARPSLKSLLLMSETRFDLDDAIPARGHLRRRATAGTE